MEPQQTPDPPIMPQAPNAAQPDQAAPTSGVPPVRTKAFPPKAGIAVAVGIVLLIIIAVVIAGRSGGGGSLPAKTTPTPTPASVPVVHRILSAAASESAFLQFEGDLATIATAAAAVQVQNQQLLPPRIELELGF